MRLGSANTYDNALQNLYTRQSELSSQQEKLTSGKNINRPSDDPTGAGQAERALTRITRVATDQRALDVQRNSITMSESTLGEASNLMQSFRELVVSAGNGTLSPTDRASVAQQLTGLRDQLFSLANRVDNNGLPLFGGLGSASTPFTDLTAGVTFNGISGQRASTETTLPGAMDGQAIWMNVPSGNGTFNVALPASPAALNTGTVSTDTGQVVSQAALTGHNYSVNFSVVAGVTTYNVYDATIAPSPVGPAILAAQPYVDGQAIQFGGMSFVAHGAPANNDAIQISPSTKSNVFNLLDDAIAGIKSGVQTRVNQTIPLALTQIDASMSKISSARGQAGDWLNRADNITNTQQGRTIQLTADKARAEDMDMIKGLSDFKKIDTGYQVALQSYAQIQKLSFFNYIS
ncbi:MAG: flagellar hook-associated protein FlgL [Rhodoferax sp.]|jgi:flagellar hook-associated protein 3 FlgL|uniref:flagellar hook-associated protein FlgL n=1 Tax=Rhodoferax sp. TaxID=50421 RepID=UPI00179C5EFA|nr:flagellar hook-associated protein FlgL [Rhodoferax sp.]NMM14897.1 flagellar hook-associated protein FlgL [Rhodoferax sp.]NMM18953.1 flagellar hook-associated protein FlgL [Rhodoferax sp.]